MRTLYLDASIAVHALRGTPPAEAWFDRTTSEPDTALISSRVLQTELTRVLRRDRLPVSNRAQVLGHVGLVAVTESVLSAAESISEHVKTLDAIHLATAVLVGGDTVVVTHDTTMSRVATQLGLTALDPLRHPDQSP